MRSNIEHARIHGARLLAPTRDLIRFTLTGPFVIPDEGPSMNFFDPGASTRTVFLPHISAQAGQEIFIANMSATQDINVVDSDGVAVVTLQETETGLFISYRSGWRYITYSTAGSAFVNEILNWTSQTVTAASATIAAVASEVYVNFAGAVTLTLPDCETWFAAHDMLTSHLLIKDVSGAASTNNVTINRAGADAIEAGTSLGITSDWGGWKLRRVKSATWGIVG